jgi:RNA 2',3'-cyclic 3'-phosphodiesterase
MRLFIALDLDESIRSRIAHFAENLHAFAPNARWMKPESLHVTLKFIGEQPETALAQIVAALQTVTAAPMAIHVQGYGFFPTPTSPRVFWVGLQDAPELASLAASIDHKMAALGIPKEDRLYTPHLTLARGGARSSGSPGARGTDRSNRTLSDLRDRLATFPQPEFGSMTAHEFFLYRSELSAKGSKYTKLAGFKLSHG